MLTVYVIGDRVIATMMYGGFAEEVVVPAASVLPMPDNMPYDIGAAVPLAYGTAHMLLWSASRAV